MLNKIIYDGLKNNNLRFKRDYEASNKKKRSISGILTYRRE